ncbi:MAG: ferrous iron transport protein A [Helicobacteraceae bacterium]|jgi:ferrous iron transport protein A|nr:ferrous iron transport protein A [Helicobacteraceae bacterium]
MSKLSTLKVGDKARISTVDCEGALRDRLISLGVARGEAFEVIGKSAMGVTFEIMVGGNRVALRRNEAELIGIEL